MLVTMFNSVSVVRYNELCVAARPPTGAAGGGAPAGRPPPPRGHPGGARVGSPAWAADTLVGRCGAGELIVLYDTNIIEHSY